MLVVLLRPRGDRPSWWYELLIVLRAVGGRGDGLGVGAIGRGCCAMLYAVAGLIRSPRWADVPDEGGAIVHARDSWRFTAGWSRMDG